MASSSVKINIERLEDAQSCSAVNPAKSPTGTDETGASASNFLIEECEILLRNNCSKYDDCIKNQEELRLQLITAETDYEYLRSWLQKAGNDYLTRDSNDENFEQLYELLLKNNFVQEFFAHGVTRDSLLLKFQKIMIQLKNLQICLTKTDDGMQFLKSEFESVAQHHETTSENTSIAETIEHEKRKETLRVNCIDHFYKCQHLSTCFEEACKEIEKLNSEHADLIQQYRAFSENTIAKAFLEYAKVHNTENASDYREMCIVEQRQRKWFEEKCALLNGFAENLNCLLQKYQDPVLPDQAGVTFTTKNESIENSTDENDSAPSNSNLANDPSCFISESKDNIEKMNFIEDSKFGDEGFLGFLPFSSSREHEDGFSTNQENEKADISLRSSNSFMVPYAIPSSSGQTCDETNIPRNKKFKTDTLKVFKKGKNESRQ